jgi:hypothetical protein
MEVAFNVAWGPLTQVAIPLIDVKGVVELALGVYGWWKARERSMSLIFEPGVHNLHLASHSMQIIIEPSLKRLKSEELFGMMGDSSRFPSHMLPLALPVIPPYSAFAPLPRRVSLCITIKTL